MQLEISLAGPGASREALADLAGLLERSPLAKYLPAERAATDETLMMGSGPGVVAALFNLAIQFVAGRSDDLSVVIRGDAGQRAQIDRTTAGDPLAVLSLMVLFDPPVGLG